MSSVRKIKRLFWIATACLFLMSASILFMPKAVEAGEQDKKWVALIGMLFWISAIAGYVLIVLANAERKRFIYLKADGNIKMNCSPGMVAFFTNVPATVADVTMIMSFLIFVVINFTSKRYDYISYVLLFLLVFSLNMHCLFNGRIYKTTKYRSTRRVSSHE